MGRFSEKNLSYKYTGQILIHSLLLGLLQLSADSSEEDAAPAEPVPLHTRGVWRGDRGEVGVDLDIWKMRSESPDALSGDQLTIVSGINSSKERMTLADDSLQFYPLKVVTSNQVLEAVVGDEGTVVQLQHGEVLTGAGGQAQVSDGFVSDEFAVRKREGLKTGTVGGKLCDGLVGYEDTLLQVHPLQPRTGSRQRLSSKSF